MAIEILPDNIVAQIAAGEVVERPASVVKELVENALDAGAANVHVEIAGGGRKLVRVSDDGSGIPTSEVELAFARHATSKLRTVDDLESIRTLGFRGEALSSITAVSRTSLVTRHRTEEAGTQLLMEAGRLLTHQTVGVPVGTVISVENLFFNTPARLKFLKAESTEKRHIAALITRYAMAYPGTRFTLVQDGREVFRSTGSGQLGDVVARAMGLDNFKNMIPVQAQNSATEDRPAVSVHGYASTPDYSRADRTQITLFVNGRWIQDSSLSYAVVQAYHTLLMNGRYPAAILMIEIDPAEVDVNVHPTKAEVRFRNANAVFSTVQRAVREAVVALAGTAQMRSSRLVAQPQQTEIQWGVPGSDVSRSRQLDIDLSLEDTGGYAHQRDGLMDSTDAGALDDATAIPEGLGAPRKPRTLPMLRVVGQVGAMYIVAEGPAGLYLIDQHAAHERILYEEFMEIYWF